MNRLKHILAIVVLTGAILGLGAQSAYAGRVGGPASEAGTIVPGDSVYFDIPFTLGRAVVSVNGNGGPVQLYVYDADGNVTTGGGAGARRTAVVDVYRAGTFRVEVRNVGLMPAVVVVGTN